MQTITFFALLLNVFFAAFGLPMALYCLFGAVIWRDLRSFVKVLLAIASWFVVLFLYLWVVPSGEMSSSQFTGIAGLMQVVFCAASLALLMYSRMITKQQTKIPGRN